MKRERERVCGCVLVSLFSRLGSLLCSVQLSSAQCRLGSRLGSGCIVRTRYAYLIIIVLCLLSLRSRKHSQEEGPIVWHVVRVKMGREGEAVQILRSLEFPQRHNHLVVPVRHRHELNRISPNSFVAVIKALNSEFPSIRLNTLQVLYDASQPNSFPPRFFISLPRKDLHLAL